MKGSTRNMLLNSLSQEREERCLLLAHAQHNLDNALDEYYEIALAEVAAYQSLINATEAKIQKLKMMRKVVK